jgi:hypothetical protein
MIIKATTTNPAIRFCTMAVTPGEFMNKATGSNCGDQRRGSAPFRADQGAGAEMISERSRSQREHNRRPGGSANLLPRCANSMRDQKARLRLISCSASNKTECLCDLEIGLVLAELAEQNVLHDAHSRTGGSAKNAQLSVDLLDTPICEHPKGYCERRKTCTRHSNVHSALLGIRQTGFVGGF